MRLKNVWWSTLSTIIQISWSLQISIFWSWSLTTGSPLAEPNTRRKSRNAFVRALSKDRALFFCLKYPSGHYRCTWRFFFFSVTKLSHDWLIYRRMRYLNINGHYEATKKRPICQNCLANRVCFNLLLAVLARLITKAGSDCLFSPKFYYIRSAFDTNSRLPWTRIFQLFLPLPPVSFIPRSLESIPPTPTLLPMYRQPSAFESGMPT